MKRLAQWMVLAFATVVALSLATHSILTWMTSAGRDASVSRLKARLAKIPPSTQQAQGAAPEAVAVAPDATPSAELIASWERLFETWKNRSIDDAFSKRWDALLDIPLHVRWGEAQYNVLSEKELELLTTFLGENADILETVRALTQPDMPSCAFSAYNQANLHWVFDVLLSANILFNTARGNFEEVPMDLASLLNMCGEDAYIEYPFVMGNGMERCLNDALMGGNIGNPAWQRLLAQLEKSRNHDLFAKDWAGVAETWLQWYDDLPASGSEVTNPPVIGQVLGWGYRYAGTPLLNHNLDAFSDVMDQLLDLAPQPYFRVKPELARIRDEYGIPVPWKLMPWQQEPGMWLISTLIHERFSGRANEEAHIDMARLAILLEQHRAQYCAYPESLNALSGAFGGQLPVNPLTGESFSYEREDGTFRLWYRDTYTDDEGQEHAAHNTWPGQWEDLGPVP